MQLFQNHWNDIVVEMKDATDGNCMVNPEFRFPSEWCNDCRAAASRMQRFNPFFSRGDAVKVISFITGHVDNWDGAWAKQINRAVNKMNESHMN